MSLINKSYTYKELDAATIETMCSRYNVNSEKAFNVAKEIQNMVIKDGDNALRHYTKKFDKTDIETFRVTPEELKKSHQEVSEEFKKAVSYACENVQKFHEQQGQGNYTVSTRPGIECSRKFTPVQAVGLYIPAGNAPLFSSIYMMAIPAKIAGCERIALCIPPQADGTIIAEMLYVADFLGLNEIYKVGGAQSIFALAHGTESIPKVDKIYGPGNSYVTAAKQIVSGFCSIDMTAGPTEALVIADETSNPDFVASDLLSQAEHGSDSQVVLVTLSKELANQVQESLQKQLQNLPRTEDILSSLGNGYIVHCDTIEEAMEMSNQYAPEHLLVSVDNPEPYAPLVKHAGSVFLGSWTPESAGDYASGSNHVLPTMGNARSIGGLSVEHFGKYITFQSTDVSAFRELGIAVELLAKRERLDAHAYAATVRLENLPS